MKLNTKNLADVELGIPQVAEGVYHARLSKVEIKANKAGTGNNLVVQCTVLDPLVLTFKEGKELQNRGQIVVSRHISLVPNEASGYDPDSMLKELAVAIKLPPAADLNVEDLANKLVMIKIEHKNEEKDEKTGKTYPAGNELRRFSPVPDNDTFSPPPF